ncbi:MAG: 16S rRNA (adenine(1518)-N(6)/adenine(1519)-N(6))-dimethyltransferase RsmA [Pseudomonadota bacterium]|nr:16S rRNA (adenine(1518)-N(6)/adenine(1519)-N(6))-dimethyltransferase RsmA [Pseudomonadota bacterium]
MLAEAALKLPEDNPLSKLPPLRDVIANYQISARKSLGQNFLLDLNISRRIAAAAGPFNKTVVLEIGSGPGGLTRSLLELGAERVLAVERDSRCIAALEDIKALVDNRLVIHNEDAFCLDIESLVDQYGRLRVVANLPYNIATPLLLGWLAKMDLFDGFLLMFQKEVADRIIAVPGSKKYGRLSVAAQWRCETRQLFTLSPRVFVPSPKVASTVVEFKPRPQTLAAADPVILEKVVAAAFAQRRKMLRSSLNKLFADPEKTLLEIGISPTARAETIDIRGFCAISRKLAELPSIN